MAALKRLQTKMKLFNLLFGILALPYQACLASCPITTLKFCEDLKTGNGYVYKYEIPAENEIEVYLNNTLIVYRGMNKTFNVSDEVIGVNNSAIILSECRNLTVISFHNPPHAKIEECSLVYNVKEREHEAVTTINQTDTLDDKSGNVDKAKATSHTKEITAVLVILALLLCIAAGFLVYRCGYIPWRDKQLDNRDPDDPAAEEANSLRDHGDGVVEEREPTHSQETHVESSLLNGHLVNSSQGERIVQPMGSEGTDTDFSQKRHAVFPLVNGNHKARVNDETKEPTPEMNGGGPLPSDSVGEQPCGSADEKKNCSGEQAGTGHVNNGVKPVENV